MPIVEPAVLIKSRNVALRLPSPCRRRFEQIGQIAKEASAVSKSLHDEIVDLHVPIADVDRRIRMSEMPRVEGGFGLAATDARMAELIRERSELIERRAQLNEHIERASPRSASWASIKSRSETFLRQADDVLKEVSIELPPLKRGQTLPDLIEHRQRRGRELDADRHRVQSAPMPSATAKARVREQVAALAERGRVGCEGLVELDGELDWPSLSRTSMAANGLDRPALASWEEVDALGLVCWLNGPVLIKKLDAEIDAVADDNAALSPEQRATRLAEIARDKLAIERVEAALVWAASDAGSSITFRADIDLRAVLGVA